MAVRFLDDAVRETKDKIMNTFEEMHHADQHFVIQALMADPWFQRLMERAKISDNLYGVGGSRNIK